MVLTMDIGNTHTVVGVFRRDEIVHRWRLSTRPDSTADDLGTLISELFTHNGIALREIDGFIVSCVVPPLTEAAKDFGAHYIGCTAMVVGPGLKTGIPILYENPREVGADRVVNAVAAVRLYGAPLIVLDFGTATTFDVISPSGEYLGGAIAPGIGLSVEALSKRAARLPLVELAVPKKVVGRNTVESLQSGLVFGYCSLAEGIIERMEKEMGYVCRIVATGGWSEMLAPLIPRIQVVDQDLTLKGLKMIHDLNAPEAP